MSDELPRDELTLLYRCTPAQVPEPLFNVGDVPEEYAVFALPADARAHYGGCIIFGKHKGKWCANTSERALVMHLLAELSAARAEVERLRALADAYHSGWTHCRQSYAEYAELKVELEAEVERLRKALQSVLQGLDGMKSCQECGCQRDVIADALAPKERP